MSRMEPMNTSVAFATLTVLVILSGPAPADVLLQSDSRMRFGEKDFAYFFIEAEDYHDDDPRGTGASWLLSSDPAALAMTVNDTAEPDPGAFASGGESITNVIFQSTVTNEVGGGHDIQWLVRFETAGIYYLYIRHHSPLGPELDRNKNDSFYYPTDFGPDPRQLKANGDDYGLLESIAFPGDVAQRGPWVWFAAREFVENSEQDPPVDQDPALFREYVVTEEMLGQDLVLEFDHRETGTMLDAFLFIETDAGIPPTNGEGPDGLGFFGVGDEVDGEFGLRNLGAEICDNGVDDNDDGLVDCDEPSCENARGCGEICDNGVDDDDDGLADCADAECSGDPACRAQPFIRANADGVGGIDLTDAVFTLRSLFQGGPAPPCTEAANSDGQGGVDLTDAIFTLRFLFQGGPNPPAPWPACGRPDPDPGPDAIDCKGFGTLCP